MDRERGQGRGGGEEENIRDLGKRRRHGLGGCCCLRSLS